MSRSIRATVSRPIMLLTLAAVSLAASIGVAEQSGEPDYASLRERWLEKSPTERALLRDRFEQLSKLDPEVQRELHRRAREMNGTLHAFRHAPPPWVRDRLADAGPGERDRELRRCLEDQFRHRGSSMRERMPDDLRQRLEAATTEQERVAVFQELRRRGREEMFPRFVEKMARRLELEVEEVERLKATPPAEQDALLANLRRRIIVSRGRPEEISTADWDAWQALPDEEFVRRAELSRVDMRGDHRGGRGRGGGFGRREGGGKVYGPWPPTGDGRPSRRGDDRALDSRAGDDQPDGAVPESDQSAFYGPATPRSPGRSGRSDRGRD